MHYGQAFVFLKILHRLVLGRKNKSMDHSRHGRHEAIHLWQDIIRQVGLYADRLSDIGSYNCLGGFEIIAASLPGG